MWQNVVMETNNSMRPEFSSENEERKGFLTNVGVGHYAHNLSSFTNIILAAFLAVSSFAFMVVRLITMLRNLGEANQTLYLVFAIITIALALAVVVVAVIGTIKAYKLRKEVLLESDEMVLVSASMCQLRFAMITFILTFFLFLVEIIQYTLLKIISNGSPISLFIWMIYLFVLAFGAMGFFFIASQNKSANLNGKDFYLTQAVRPVGRFEFFFISLGNAAKSLGLFLFNFVMIFVKAFINIFIGAFKIVVGIGKGVYQFFVKFVKTFLNRSYRTKLSYVFMGAGHAFMRRPFKTIMYLIMQVGYILYMFLPTGGFYWLSKFDNLGDVAVEYEYVCQIPGIPLDECPSEALAKSQAIFKDNSMLIVLYSVATVILTIAFFVLYWLSIKGVARADEKYSEYARGDIESNPIPTLKEELKALLNEKFHLSTLSIPALTITIFTVLPLVFMILLAFTNYNAVNGPPNTLFTWVGLDTFSKLFTSVGGSSFSTAFADIVQWTFIWAFFATFTNYIFGLLLAMMINRKGIKLKKLWRTVFVITIAVPQFVTLLLMSRLLNKYGPINETLLQLGWISQHIEFLTRPLTAKITVILVNVWVGVPYTMLITSGILMNIPADLYESARIDGAGPFSQFTKITLPYMLFVTGPYLITQFIGNINNFNVIFFLTGGGPSAQLPGVQYGKTDILVTWLYSLTVGGAQQEYAIGSALGIFIFIISAFITLSLYSRTSAATQEGEFA